MQSRLVVGNEMLTLSGVLARGWTRTMVDALLVGPDATKPNPYSKRAVPMRLYARVRVEAAEKDPQWQRLKQKADRRRLTVAKGIHAKRTSILKFAETVSIRIPRLATARHQAVDHYNNLWWSRGRDDKWASLDAHPAFLDRITVNFLRHATSRYEQLLETIYGKVGVAEARRRIRHRVLDGIAKVYPELAAECERQKVPGASIG